MLTLNVTLTRTLSPTLTFEPNPHHNPKLDLDPNRHPKRDSQRGETDQAVRVGNPFFGEGNSL